MVWSHDHMMMQKFYSVASGIQSIKFLQPIRGDQASLYRPWLTSFQPDRKHEVVKTNNFWHRWCFKAGFCRILKSRILKDVGFQWNPTDIPTNSNGFHRIPTDPNGFHRKKYEKVGKCWKKSEIYDPTFYDPTLAFSELGWVHCSELETLTGNTSSRKW